LFTGGDEGQMKVIKQWIEDSDVYLLILGGRYGSIDPKSGKSYTHLEYEYASELGKPMFACVMTNEYIDNKIQGSNYKEIREQSNIDGFSEFKNLVMSKVVFPCHDTNEMKYQIMRKMKELDRDDSLTGWIRASESYNSALLSEEIARLSQENYQLRDRIESLIKAENQTASVMINGIAFHEIFTLLRGVTLLEEDFSERERIPMIEIINIPISSASSYNSFVNDALKEVKAGQMQNILDLLIFLSRFIMAERGEMNFELLEITSLYKMRILFDVDILEYFESKKNILYKDVRFTDAGKLFIKIIRTQEIKKSFNS
jgi:uncharacterized protein YdcH (DUF465 family)